MKGSQVHEDESSLVSSLCSALATANARCVRGGLEAASPVLELE
jgi:hypothetical protein